MKFYEKDFSKTLILKLRNKGIRIIGLQAIPDMTSSMPYANATRGYIIDDNGTGRCWTYMEVVQNGDRI